MNDLVPFLLALRKLDANLQAEVGLDERFQHVRDLSEADARLMVRICQRGAQNGMLVALDPSDIQLPPDERASEVLRVYREMCASPIPSDAAQASVDRNLISLRATFPRVAFVVERAAKKRGIEPGDVTDAMLDEDGPLTDADRALLEQQGHSQGSATIQRDSAEMDDLGEDTQRRALPAETPYRRVDTRPGQFCHADDDGDCVWAGCPQLRDGEPGKSGRHCPLDVRDEK